ncbi:N-acetylmuramoyl-L-alanine amidase, partial [Clostridioides difficile]
MGEESILRPARAPGHGGNDKGTESKTSNRYEKDLNLQIAKKLANKLSKQKDIQV